MRPVRRSTRTAAGACADVDRNANRDTDLNTRDTLHDARTGSDDPGAETRQTRRLVVKDSRISAPAPPDGGGWRVHGRGSTQDRKADAARDRAARAGAAGSRGYRYLHHAIDDHSRVAYSEILDDERKEIAAAFWTRANAFFATLGVTVTAVMTDNGSCYRSYAFANALGDIEHKRTKPYRPQTNGKVERFNRTLATEWAYAAACDSEQAREAAYQDWIHHHNHHRPHTGIGGQVPSARVHNLTGKYT
ncbi:transposase InsO family protein [Sinomonas atrocyanea]|nr:transposase InsO family protein [Sinomonas atrocyanea]MDR6623643.1 transposase InsO family protein [Sinomonas atrocyanea]